MQNRITIYDVVLTFVFCFIPDWIGDHFWDIFLYLWLPSGRSGSFSENIFWASGPYKAPQRTAYILYCFQVARVPPKTGREQRR